MLTDQHFLEGKQNIMKVLHSFVMINIFVAVFGTACQKCNLSLKCLCPFAFTVRFVSRVQLSSSATRIVVFKFKIFLDSILNNQNLLLFIKLSFEFKLMFLKGQKVQCPRKLHFVCTFFFFVNQSGDENIIITYFLYYLSSFFLVFQST